MAVASPGLPMAPAVPDPGAALIAPEPRCRSGLGLDPAVPGPGDAEAMASVWACGGTAVLTPFDLTDEEQAVRRVAGPEFDSDYYLIANGDVCRTGMDPLCHYVRSGRLEDRRPNAWFDPAWYRAAHPEADASGLDAFSYYLRHGRAFGHRPQPRAAAARRALAQARPPHSRHADWAPGTVVHLHPHRLMELAGARLAGGSGLTVSLSQDRYAGTPGGIQSLIASEQSAFNRRGEAYLHLAPAVPLLTLAADPAPEGAAGGGRVPSFLHVTLDGDTLGVAAAGEVLDLLAALAARLPALRRLVVHCMFGHSTGFVTALHRALHAGAGAPLVAVFWLHDYESLCAGYTLLRNDVAFCGAPPVDSAACGICVYGEGRAAHLAGIQALFRAVPFHVVAPSAAALDVWLRRADLPHLSAQVGEVLRIEPAGLRRQVAGTSGAVVPRGSLANPVRLAFVGLPTPGKGWEAFCGIASHLARSSAYRLLHFASCGDQGVPGVGFMHVQVTPAAPDAMVRALAAAGTDLVLVLSPWPETFCIVASEALAAGADVLTLECSGNVADLVRQSGRGQVFATVEDVLAFLTGPRALRHVQARLAAGAETGELRLAGATAALALPQAEAGAGAVAGGR